MRKVPVDFPDVLRIEPVGKCNFKCVHCPTGKQPNKREILSNKRFTAIIDQCIAANFIPRVVVLYHGGEPLINKNLADFIRILKKIGVKKTVITTNASLLSQERSRELIMAGLDEMKVSFDGETPEENNEIRKNGNFYRDATNVKILLRLRKKLKRDNPNIIINNVRICNENTLNIFKHNGGRRLFVFPAAPEYLSTYFSDESDKIEFRSFPGMVWPGYNQSGEFKKLSFPFKKPRYCGSLFETVTILSNGDVVLCCYDLNGELVLGNVFKTNIFSIWESKKYTSLRVGFKARIYSSLCNKCNIVSPRYLCKEELI